MGYDSSVPALCGDNPALYNYTDYSDRLEEEYTDVVSCAIALGLKPDADISAWKWERFKKRLEEMEEQNGIEG